MTIQIHGKEYKTVAERVNEIHAELKGKHLSIETELVSWEGGIVIIKATVTTDNGVYTGHAYEDESRGQINKTSALENAETSAIGRALSSAGFAGSEFASANEVQNAIAQQQGMTASVFSKRLSDAKKAFADAGISEVFESCLEANYGSKNPVEIIKTQLDNAEKVIQALNKAYKEALS